MFEFLGNIGSALGNAGKAVGSALGNVGGKIADVGGKIGNTIKTSPLADKLAGGFERSREKWEEMDEEDKKDFLDRFGSSQQSNPYAGLGNLTSSVNFQTQPLQQRQMQFYIPAERNFY